MLEDEVLAEAPLATAPVHEEPPAAVELAPSVVEIDEAVIAPVPVLEEEAVAKTERTAKSGHADIGKNSDEDNRKGAKVPAAKVAKNRIK